MTFEIVTDRKTGKSAAPKTVGWARGRKRPRQRIFKFCSPDCAARDPGFSNSGRLTMNPG